MSEKCFHEPNCDSTDTIKCTVEYRDDGGNWQEDVFWYCADHAVENGFCCGCGIFCAGIDSFDFIHKGLCDNCYDEVRSQMEEFDESELDYNVVW